MARTGEIARNVLKGIGIAALVFGCLVCGSRAKGVAAQSWTASQTGWVSSVAGTR